MRGTQQRFSRRDFLARAACAGAMAALGPTLPGLASAAQLSACPIVVFSKIYQELNLPFADAAALTAQAGLDGIDCPVRKGGEIDPEKVADQLPAYAALLRKQGVDVKLLTSGITKVTSPHAEAVLRTARKLGVQFYRLGFFGPAADRSSKQQAAEIRAQLKDVAALNREIGICGLFQNHRGSFGANLSDLKEVVGEFEPSDLGVAFDIGHALVSHGKDWRSHFEELKSHLKIVYIKDVTSTGQWVPFGQGEIPRSGYIARLKELNYSAPISLHIEFDWPKIGSGKNRETLLKALRESTAVLRKWLREA